MKELLKKIIHKAALTLVPISVGVLTVITTLFMLIEHSFPYFAISSIALGFGLFFWFCALNYKVYFRFYFASFYLLQLGVFLLIHNLGFGLLPLKTLWPCFMIFISLSFLASGFIKYHRPRPVFIVLAIAFLFLGFLFLLFSSDIITLSFISFVLFSVPIFVVPVAVLFLSWLFNERSRSEAIDES